MPIQDRGNGMLMEDWLRECCELFEDEDGNVTLKATDLLDIAKYVSKGRDALVKIAIIKNSLDKYESIENKDDVSLCNVIKEIIKEEFTRVEL